MRIKLFTDPLPNPIQLLNGYLKDGGTSIIKAAFEHSFFIDPEKVRAKTPMFDGAARKSRTHYPGLEHGEYSNWKGMPVHLDLNGKAQQAWKRYTGRPLEKKSGFGVRHIWGNPWDPCAFTAGWNLCYMPYWVGMLTEEQHPYRTLQRAIEQASFELYFRKNPVLNSLPTFVEDPKFDLDSLLDDQPVLLLGPLSNGLQAIEPISLDLFSPEDIVRSIRTRSGKSWLNLIAASRALLGLPFEEFGTINVENTSKSTVRRMLRETKLELHDLLDLVQQLAPPHRA
jgi:hypothetical protein